MSFNKNCIGRTFRQTQGPPEHETDDIFYGNLHKAQDRQYKKPNTVFSVLYKLFLLINKNSYIPNYDVRIHKE